MVMENYELVTSLGKGALWMFFKTITLLEALDLGGCHCDGGRPRNQRRCFRSCLLPVW